ncbi:lipase secretion chaperone [Vibrio mimicus]|nr:lipase secretion chaperone [Vibrio mimicus]QXC56035.1 lipase secretion chaperone [Vibrio mimicus]
MKKFALSFGALVVVGGLGAIFGFSAQPAMPISVTPSQADIQPDKSSSRDLLEYFLSGLGESSMPEITQQVQQYEQENQGFLIDGDLFERYVRYKAALAELTFPEIDGALTAQDWLQLHQALLELQAQYFSAEQQALFAEENRLRELAIQKQLILEQYGEEEGQKHWQDLLAEQPDFIQRSEAATQLLPQLTHIAQGDEQQRYLARVALVGEQGAQRLAELDDSRSQFEQQFSQYYQQRSAILARVDLSSSEQQSQIQQLREASFAPEQWRRIEALERLSDSGQ